MRPTRSLSRRRARGARAEASLVALAAFALAALAALVLAACGGAGPGKPSAPAPPAPAASSRAAPPCPTTILPGGDPLEAEGFEGKRIARVCFVGTEAAKKDAARGASLHEGDTFSADRARADLESMARLGVFDDVAAYGLAGREAMVLVYAARERPRVADVSVTGAKLLGDAALTAKLPVEKLAPYEPQKVNAIAQAICDEYRSRGYEACAARLVAEDAGPGLVRVRIAITEGQERRFGKIATRGNAKVREAELLKVAELAAGQPFVPEAVERAALLLSALYYDRGMVHVTVRTDVGAAGADGRVPVTFVIEEGDVFTLAAIHATKLGAPVETELLTKVVRSRPGQTFVRKTLLEDLERIKKHFQAQGVAVEIEPVTEIDPKKKTITLTLPIEAAR